MSRYLVKNPKRSIAALATALAAVGVAVGSGASFSSQTANPANTFASGTLLQSNSKNGTSIVTGSNMKPGDVRTGTVEITNTGTLAGAFKLVETNDSNGFSADQLELTIDDVTNASSPTQLYKDDLGAVAAGGISLGNYAAAEKRTYRFSVELKSTAPNADQGKSATADYEWIAAPAS